MKEQNKNIRKVAILGAGKMGLWLAESLCFDYQVAVYDTVPDKMRYMFRTQRLEKPDELLRFSPDLLINAVNLEKTIPVFNQVVPLLPRHTILSDIASVKNGLKIFYEGCKHQFVSTHPMFGPTFGNVRELGSENAIIISESCEKGKQFFREFYESLKLRIFEYSFDQHDQTIAYSLSIPFASSLIFASCMKKMEVPGTTFKKHLDIANGLLSEDKFLLSEILMNPFTLPQLERIRESLDKLIKMVGDRNTEGVHRFLAGAKANVGKEDPSDN